VLSVDIPYAGPVLIARQRYFCTVQVWDDHNQMTTSRVPSWFEIGLRACSDWSARWIGAPDTSAATAVSLPSIWIANQTLSKPLLAKLSRSATRSLWPRFRRAPRS